MTVWYFDSGSTSGLVLANRAHLCVPMGDATTTTMTLTTDIATAAAEFKEIPAPAIPSTVLTASQVQAGPAIEPLKRLFLYSADEWESFIDEWATACLKGQYKKVQRLAGANDKGIDIVGFVDDGLLTSAWDNYQCKHYDHALHPADAWPEIAKILWYSFKGHYAPPRAYFFVAPRGTGTTLSQLLANPATLKAGLKKSGKSLPR